MVSHRSREGGFLFFKSLSATACIAAVLCGCATHAKREARVELPEFQSSAQAALFERHCQALINKEIVPYLQTLNSQNLQLAGAWARFRQARAQAKQRRARQWPELILRANASRSQIPTVAASPQNGEGRAPPQAPAVGEEGARPAIIQNQFELALPASYEVDAWNRLGQLSKAAEFSARAQQTDARALVVSLSAQLLEAWYGLGFLQAQRALLVRQRDIAKQLLALAKLRYLNGQTSALDALQQRQQLLSLAASLSDNRELRATLHNQMQVLLGEQPHITETSDFHPGLPSLPALDNDVVFSANLLAARPDVLAAFYQLQVADAELAAALAARLPTVRLTASFFDRAGDINYLGDDVFWRIAAALTQPIFNAGRLAAQAEASRAGVEQALIHYQQTLLTSLQELANAWVSETALRERIAYLSEQEQIATDALALVENQYRRGATDFLRVLNAFTSLTDVQTQLLQAQRNHMRSRVQLCRVLGDGWLAQLDVKKAHL